MIKIRLFLPTNGRLVFLLLLIIVFSSRFFAAHPASSLDQAKADLIRALADQNPQKIIQAQLRIGDLLFDQKDYEQALSYYYQALQAAKTDGDKQYQGMTECKIARLFYEISMLSDAIKHYNAGLEYLKQGEWKEEEIKALNERAMTLALQGKWQLGMKDLTRAMEYFDDQKVDNPLLLSRTHNCMGNILNRFNDIPRARFHLEQALNIAQKHQDMNLVARYTNNLASTYKNEKKNQHAGRLYQKALEISIKVKNYKQLFVAHLNLGDLALFAKDYQSCFSHYNQAYQANQILNYRQAQAILLLKRGQAYLDNNQLNRAKEDLEEAQLIAEDIGNRDALNHIYKTLAAIYKKMGDQTLALKAHEKLSKLEETIFDPKITGEIQKIQSKYENSKFKKKIAREKSVWLILLIGLAVVALISLFLARMIWLDRIRIKKQTRQLVQLKEAQINHQRKQIKDLQVKIDEYFSRKPAQKKYKNYLMPEEESHFYLKCLNEIMDEGKVFLDNELTLAKLAKHLKIHPKALSQLINSKTGKNFSEYINQYRLRETKRLLQETGKEELNILDIAFESGFNSKSTFNSVFRKEVGCSPSAYRQQFTNQ